MCYGDWVKPRFSDARNFGAQSKSDELLDPDIIAPDPFATHDCLNVLSPDHLMSLQSEGTMSEDLPSPAINGRLRPRKSNAPSPQTKTARKTEGKVAQDKAKRTSTPSKPTPNNPDDLATPQFLCPYCDRKFASKQTVSKHIRRIHLSTSKQDSFIGCLFCSHAEAEANDIVRHMVDSHPNQYFACLDCHTRFTYTSDLAQHKLNVCEKQKPYRSKLRQKASTGSKKSQKKLNIGEEDQYMNREFTDGGFNGIVISCELKPSKVHEGADIEENITTNFILPPSKSLGSNAMIEKNAVIVLDDIQWNKRIPPNFSFHNTDADQILSRLGVVHRSPRAGESTRRDWFRTIDESTQKFEKCFDTSFYTRVASNVQENLAKFLDGSFNFNPDPDNTIKTRKSKNNVVINTAEGFPILLACEQYSRNVFDSYMPRGIAPKHKWKWDTIENEKNFSNYRQLKRDSHTNNCIISLVSCLDIWTQLCMRRKFEDKFSNSAIEKKTEKLNTIGKELKVILESREIPTSSTELVRCTGKPSPIRDGIELPASLGLVPLSPRPDVKPAVLSGEWVRPRCYVCCACGAQTRDSRALSAHISAEHPNAQVQHYEIVGEPLLNADILKHLYVPPSQVYNRTRPLRGFRDCTKCKKSISLEDLHQHMLDCAGDTPAVRRKCRYRPFGVRRRRPRLPDNTIRKKIRKDIRTRHRQKNHMRSRPRIRSEVGDAETIRKMIADLPAKRHRVLVNPLNSMLRSSRKHDKQRNKLMVKRRSSEDPKNRRVRSIKEKNSSESSDPINRDDNSETSKEDEDNKKTLKPQMHRIQTKNVRQSENLKRKSVLNRAKRKIQMKCLNAIKTKTNDQQNYQTTESDSIKASNGQNQGLPADNSPERIDVNSEQFRAREHAGRGGLGPRNEQPGSSRQNENANNSNIEPAPNTPLKHSIASLTANLETYDRSVQLQQQYLLEQECINIAHHGPTGQQQLFENEAAVMRLDKPPLPCKNGPPTPEPNPNQKNNKFNKPKKGLNDCINMLMNKLADPVPSALNTKNTNVQCKNSETLDTDPMFYAHAPTIDSEIDPKPAEVFSRFVLPPERAIEVCNETAHLQIQPEPTSTNWAINYEKAVTHPKYRGSGKNKNSLVMPEMSTPQKQKDVLGKRKSTRTRSNVRTNTEMQQNLFNLPSQIEMIPQVLDVSFKTPTSSRTRRDSNTKVVVSPGTSTKKLKHHEVNKKNEALQGQRLEMYSEPQYHSLLGNWFPDQKLLLAAQKAMAPQRLLSEQRPFNKQKTLSKNRSRADSRAQVDQHCIEQWSQTGQMLFVDPRTHCEQRQFSNLMAYGEQRSYVDTSYSDQKAYNDQLQYANLRLLEDQRKLPERRSMTDQRPHTDVRPRCDHRLLNEHAYLEQTSLTDQSAYIAPRLQTDQWPHSEQWSHGDQWRHNESLPHDRRPNTEQQPHTKTRPHLVRTSYCEKPQLEQAFVEKRQTSDNGALEVMPHNEQRSHLDQRANSDQRVFIEQMPLHEKSLLSERQSYDNRQSIERSESIGRKQSVEGRPSNERRSSEERRPSDEGGPSVERGPSVKHSHSIEQRESEQTFNSEHKLLAEQLTFMGQKSHSEQLSPTDHRLYNEIQPNDLRSSVENRGWLDQRSLATQQMIKDHRTEKNDQSAYVRVLDARRSSVDNGSLKDQRPIYEQNSLSVPRVGERRISNEYLLTQEERSIIDDRSSEVQKPLIKTRTFNEENNLLNGNRLSANTKSSVKSPVVEKTSSTRTKTPIGINTSVEKNALMDNQIFTENKATPEAYPTSQIRRTIPSILYPENPIEQPTTDNYSPEQEMVNKGVEEAYSETDYSKISSAVSPPQAHARTNERNILRPTTYPLDLSGKMPLERSEDLSKHDNLLIMGNYDSYESLDLSSNKISDRQRLRDDINVGEGVVDLRIKFSQSGIHEGSIDLSANSSANDINNRNDWSFRRCEDNNMPTDLSVRGNLDNISVENQVERPMYEEPVTYDKEPVIYDDERFIDEVQDLSSHKPKLTEEFENITTLEPTDLSGKHSIQSINPVTTVGLDVPVINTKDDNIYVSSDLTVDDEDSAIIITKVENVQQGDITTDEETTLLQSTQGFSPKKAQLDKESKTSEEINIQNSQSPYRSEQSPLLLQKPVYDPTLKIPQYKIPEASTNLEDNVLHSSVSTVSTCGLTTTPLINVPSTSFAISLPKSLQNSSNYESSMNTQNVSLDKLPKGHTGYSLNVPVNTIVQTIPVYTLPNTVISSTSVNTYESTTPVYTLANACISVTKFESSLATTLSKTELSIASSTVANTTSVYTLAGTTIVSPIDNNAVPDNGSILGQVADNRVNIEASVGETSLEIDKQNKSDQVLKAAESSTIKTKSFEQDPETARKIALLPKELVDILGNMPADHRNQLLNVLPQYVTTTTTATTNDEVNVQNSTYVSASMSKISSQTLPYNQHTQRDLLPFPKYNSALSTMNTSLQNYCMPANVHPSMSQMFCHYEFDKKYSFPYLLPPPPPPPPPPLPPQSPPPLPPPPLPPMLPQSSQVIETQTVCDIKPPLITVKSTKEEKDSELLNVDDERHSSMSDPKNKINDFTKDVMTIDKELFEIAKDLTRPTVSLSQNFTNYTTILKTDKQRQVNDKTASLRAVRIKTQSERNKSASTETQLYTKTIIETETQILSVSTIQPESQIFKKTTVEFQSQAVEKTELESLSAIVIDPDDEINKSSEPKKSLAIQQAEVSSTQHGNKNIPVECIFPTGISPTELETHPENSRGISIPTEEIVIKKDEDLIQTDNPISKSGLVTSSIVVENKDRKSSNDINIIQKYKNQNVSVVDESIAAPGNSSSRNVAIESVNYPANQSSEIKQDSSDEVKSSQVLDPSLEKHKVVTGDEESDDDVSLAVIVKQKQRDQHNLVHQLESSSQKLAQKTALRLNKKVKNIKKNSNKKDLKDVIGKPMAVNINDQTPNHLNDITTKTESIDNDKITTRIADYSDIHKANINKESGHPSKTNDLFTEENVESVEYAIEIPKENKEVHIDARNENQSEGIKTLNNITSEKPGPVEVIMKNNNTGYDKKALEVTEKVNLISEVNEQDKIQEIPMNVDYDNIATSLNVDTKKSKKKTKILRKSRKLKDGIISSPLRRHNIGLEATVSVEPTEGNSLSAEINYQDDNDVTGAEGIKQVNCLSQDFFRIASNSRKRIKKKLKTKKFKYMDRSKGTLLKKLQLESEIEFNISMPLRRSRRGKSMFIESVLAVTDHVALNESTMEEKQPLTKKQLIFSKLLLEEENTVCCQASSTPEKGLIDGHNVIPHNTDIVSDTTLLTSNIQNYARDTGKSKATKRKKSPQAKKKKNKSIDIAYFHEDADSDFIYKDSKSASLPECSIDIGSIPLPKTKNEHCVDGTMPYVTNKEMDIISQDYEDKITFKDKEGEVENSDKLIQSTEKRKLTTNDPSAKPKKTKLVFKEVQNKEHDDSIQELNVQNTEEPSMSTETRITCYMPALRRTRSKSVVVKSSTADIYDPYDINLDDMIEKETFGKKSFTPNKNSYSNQLGKRSYHQEQTNCKTINKLETPSKTHTVVSKPKKPLYYTDKIMEMPPSCSKDYDDSDSDDSSKSDVPLKRYVDEKEKRILELEDSADMLNDDDSDIDLIEHVNEQQHYKRKKNRRTLTSFNDLVKSRVQNEADEQRRSEQFMASFGFFSERKPRKSNLLASKKISETFHVIANDSDDMYFGYKERAKRSLQNENRKSIEGGTSSRAQQQSGSRKMAKRGGKNTYIEPLPCYCGICKKEFRRPDNYLRHQMTLLHISKLSEIEMKVKTVPIHEEPNYLIVYKQQMDKLKILTNKLAKQKKNSRSAQKIKLPTLDQILADVNKTIREQQLSQRGLLSRDEALFLDCCELLKSHKSDVGTSHKNNVNTEHTTNLNSENSKYTCPATETTVKEYDLLEKPTKGDGDVDSITAKNILESEEVRNLENDLICGLKEAANANTLKTKVPYQRSVSDVGLFEDIRLSYTNPNAGETYEPMNSYKPVQESVSRSKGKKKFQVKTKLYPDIIDNIDMFEDKFDKIKRKCRSQAAAAKQIKTPSEPYTSHKSRKKSEKKKGKKNSKKVHQSTQVLTKGALKGFDGIKVSIPTSDINIAAIVTSIENSSKKKKKSSSKKKRSKNESESSGKYDSDPRTKDSLPPQKKVDVYEFMDNEDAELFEFRPSTLMERFKSISNKETAIISKLHPVVNEVENTSESVSDGDDFVYMSDDYVCSDNETENSLLSCEVSNKVASELKKSSLKRKDAIEKNTVMGKIFKNNAVRSDKKITKCKELSKPQANLDQLFDSLLEDDPNSSMLKNDALSPRKDESVTSKQYNHPQEYYKCNNSTPPSGDEFSSPTKFSSPSRKHYSTSSPKEFDDLSIPSTSKRYDDLYTTIDCGPSTSSRKHDTTIRKPYRSLSLTKQETTSSKRRDSKTSKSYMIGATQDTEHLPPTSDDIAHKTSEAKEKLALTKLDEGISTSYDYSAEVFDQISAEDDMGVARQRARRKCTVGKQNVLAETWSSESEPDGGPPRPNSAESVVLGSGRRKKGKKKDGQPSGGRRAFSRQVTFKKQNVEGRVASSNHTNSARGSRWGEHSADGDCLEAYDVPGPSVPHAPLGPPGPKPRPRSFDYYWSSEGDEEQEHLQQHGWIVGDSHKKLVTMLAHAKGRKRNNDDKRHLVE